MTDPDTMTEVLVLLVLERHTRTVRQLQVATGVPAEQLRAALSTMIRQGKVRVRGDLAGTVVVPTGNN